VKIYEQQTLPPGYRWGAHWADMSLGRSGYYILRDDGARVRAHCTPCSEDGLSFREFAEAFESEAEAVA